MRRNYEKDTVAVLLHVPVEVYNEYLEVIKKLGYSRTIHSTKIFQSAIEKVIKENNGSGHKKK